MTPSLLPAALRTRLALPDRHPGRDCTVTGPLLGHTLLRGPGNATARSRIMFRVFFTGTQVFPACSALTEQSLNSPGALPPPGRRSQALGEPSWGQSGGTLGTQATQSEGRESEGVIRARGQVAASVQRPQIRPAGRPIALPAALKKTQKIKNSGELSV